MRESMTNTSARQKKQRSAAAHTVNRWHLRLRRSLVTTKPSPGDIDGYILTTVGSAVDVEVAEHYEEWKGTHQLDCWPAYTDQPGEMSQAWWEERFGHTKERPPAAKGIIKLILGR
jgi:hypothetical protein